MARTLRQTRLAVAGSVILVCLVLVFYVGVDLIHHPSFLRPRDYIDMNKHSLDLSTLVDRMVRANMDIGNGNVHSNTTVVHYTPRNLSKQGVDVLIVSQMRSGSTFLGKLLGYRQDTFYWYEPLITTTAWGFLRGRNQLCHNLQGTCNIIPESDTNTHEKALQLLTDIYNCDIDSHFNAMKVLPVLIPPTWSQYVECFKSRKLPYECGQHLVKSCTTAKHRVTKVVGMDVVGVSSLLDRNSNLKIVQLVRDPRGIVNSRLHTFWYRKILPTDTSIEQDMKTLCSRLRDDIKTGTYYAQMFPARYKIVQYEDIGYSPDKIMKLYKYLGMEELDRYDTFIQAIFDKPKNKSTKSFHPYDTFIKTLFDRSKNKATDCFHPYSYRQELPWHIAEKVQNNCHGVFNELGLRIFSNKSEYEDLSIDVTLGEFPFKIS